jgi:hypothetical protein
MNRTPGKKMFGCSAQLNGELPSAFGIAAPPSTGNTQNLVKDQNSTCTGQWAEVDTRSGEHNGLPISFRPPPGLPPPDLPTLLPARLPQPASNVGLQKKFLEPPTISEWKEIDAKLTPPTLSPATSPSCFTPPPGLSLDEEGAVTRDDASECSAVDAFGTEAASRVSGFQPENAEIIDTQDTQVLLKLSDYIADQPSKCGMPGCPSLGSCNHHLGLCRPCDFVHRDGCRQGADCPFCHLCGPEDNKQKKKERQKLMKNTKKWYAAMAGQLQANSLRPFAFRG